MITDNEEYQKERRKRFGGPIGASMSAMDINDARKEAFEQGVKWCEQQLTAQHDKEMEEFEYWKHENVRFYDKELRFFVLIDVEHKLSFSELLAVFRERRGITHA